jgi:TonB-dependent SusC/RagA subfamily outer membrane receptor
MKLICIILILVCFPIFVYGQKAEKRISITGTVMNGEQRPVEGATIYIDDKITSSSSDSYGFYKLVIKSGAKKIMASSEIFGDSTVEIDGRTKIDFMLIGHKNKLLLTSDSLTLKGKSNRKERNLTQRKQNSTVGSDTKSDNYFKYKDIFDMIRAELPGVQISGTSVIIQGASTFGGSNEALYILDGTPVNQISGIPPGDVKSIKLVKGPDAAFYGIRGGNGVVVITTRRGGDKR